MRERLEPLLLVVAVGAAVAIGAKRLKIPYNVALVIVGLLLVLANVLPNTPLDPSVVLELFVPVLVFEGALFADADGLRRSARPILALAVPGVALSLLGTALVATFVLKLPFPIALLLGALLSITDTVSVLLAFRAVKVPHRLAAIMEGESLFNDGTALVLVSLAATVVSTGVFDSVTTLRLLGIAIVLGTLVGLALGVIGTAILRSTPDHLTAILASIVLVFATSVLAERVHASAIIAVVVSGLFVGKAARRLLDPSRVLALLGFWETAGFGINVLLFLLVGMQINARTLVEEAASILLSLLALHAGRAVAVYGCFGVLRALGKDQVPLRWQHVMVAGNIKGALSMAAVLALPAGFVLRDRLVAIVFGVTFVTLVVQALPFAWLLRVLRVSLSAGTESIDAARATLITARRGQTELDELMSAGLVSRKQHAEWRAALQRQLIDAERELRVRTQGTRDHGVQVSVLTAQKAALLDAVRKGLLGSEAAEAAVSDLDRRLMALEVTEDP